MQDQLHRTVVISQRRSQKSHSEQAASGTKGNAAYEALEAVTQARSEAVKHTLEKTEALEKHVKTAPMRAESLATTEADFLQTLLERHEEAQRNINNLSTQLCQTRSTQ